MSLNAAVLHFAGDHEEAERAAGELPEAWSPMPWTRDGAANDDAPPRRREPVEPPVIHSGDSGLLWMPGRGR